MNTKLIDRRMNTNTKLVDRLTRLMSFNPDYESALCPLIYTLRVQMTEERQNRRAQLIEMLQQPPSTARARYYPLTDAAIRLGIEEPLTEWLGISHSESAKISDTIAQASEGSKAQALIDCFESFGASQS